MYQLSGFGWAAAERGGELAGDDTDASDIDRIWTIDASHGGSDHITTGAGDDIIIGGEDGELVVGQQIATDGAAETVIEDTEQGDGDEILAGDGKNLVFVAGGIALPR